MGMATMGHGAWLPWGMAHTMEHGYQTARAKGACNCCGSSAAAGGVAAEENV